MNVYEIGGTDGPPAPTPTPTQAAPTPTPVQIVGGDGYAYLGCRADDAVDRIMGAIEVVSGTEMTNEVRGWVSYFSSIRVLSGAYKMVRA